MVSTGSAFTGRDAAAIVATANKESCQEQPEDIEYHCSGLSVRIQHKITSEVSQDVIRWATDLTRNNMSALYDETWGWSTKSKLKELGHARAHHLIAYPDNPVPTRPVAYLHYRWEQDPPKEERRKGQPVFPVAYVYELQLTEEARGKGLGSYMMSLVEATRTKLSCDAHQYTQASKHKMHKVMLTCFTRNTGALRMYQRIGYSRDETSPDPAVDGPAFAGYEILSKTLC